MKQFFLKTLTFLRVVDPHDQLLSITNLAMLVVLYKLIVAPTTNIVDLGSLLVAFGNYSFKKYINKNGAVGSIVSQVNPEAVEKEENV